MSGKQIKMVLEQIQTNDVLSGAYSETFHFKPVNEDLKKHCTLKVSGGSDARERLKTLGLPIEKGDSVILEIGVKEVQSKIIKEEPEEKPEE